MSKEINIKRILGFAKGVKPNIGVSRVFHFVNGKIELAQYTELPHTEQDLTIYCVTTQEEKQIVDNLTEEEINELFKRTSKDIVSKTDGTNKNLPTRAEKE